MKKVLIVEENPRMSAFYAEELANEGYQVLSANDGAEALRVASNCQPDVVVLDLVLPDMDGLDVMAHMLADRPHLPIIIYTDCPAYQDSFMSWPADAYLCKSGQLTELKKCIKEVLVLSPDRTKMGQLTLVS